MTVVIIFEGLAEEQRLKEEAIEAKKQAEIVEKARIAEEKRKAEEERLRLEELARLADEQPEVEARYNQMRENGMLATKKRYRDLEPKYLACDPQPSPYDERDLTSFITQWREQVDSDLIKAANNCQIAENVIREMQNIQGEAMAMFDLGKLEWCKDYTN